LEDFPASGAFLVHQAEEKDNSSFHAEPAICVTSDILPHERKQPLSGGRVTQKQRKDEDEKESTE